MEDIEWVCRYCGFESMYKESKYCPMCGKNKKYA